jgi:pimeloyl-ACP methyl ester carboxylesterase
MWFLVIPLASVMILVLIGFTYESLAAAAAWRNYPPPGERVDVGGYHLHIHVEGVANGSPTVILDHGGTGLSAQWGWVMPQLAQQARVAAYDRPGMGWSDAPFEQIDAVHVARDLRTALDTLGIQGPYLMVGHSMGALTVRVFTQLYPDDVVGLVLIDPRDVTWEGVYDVDPQFSPAAAWAAGAAGRVGLGRLIGRFSPDLDGLPDEQRQQAKAIAYSHHHIGSAGIEANIGDSAAAWLRQNEQLPDIPLLVLSAADSGGGFDQQQRSAFTRLHARLAERAPQGEHHTLTNANHLTIVTHEEPARQVAAAIRSMMGE